MKRTHLKTLKTAKENLYEEFLNSKGRERTDLLVKIMEIDEDMEAFKKNQEDPITVKDKMSNDIKKEKV